MFRSSLELLCVTNNRTQCQSGYVNSRSSYLETRSLLSSQCDSKSHHPFHPYLSADESHTPAATCAAVFMLWMFVCAHQGAYCASIFTARISDKLNESPESHYLPAHSCSVLSSLFSDSVFTFLFSFLTFSLLAVCLLIPCCLSQQGGILPPSATSFLHLFWVHILHIPISSQRSK